MNGHDKRIDLGMRVYVVWVHFRAFLMACGLASLRLHDGSGLVEVCV